MPQIFTEKLLLVGVLIGIHATRAQSDLSGSWTFKAQQSVSGNLYSNGSPKSVLIQQDPKAISLTKVTASTDGDVTATETLSFDGKPTQSTTASKRKKVITGEWSSDRKTFTEVSLVYDATDSTKLYFRTTDTWGIDSGELTLDRKAENRANGEIWESRATYNKR